MTVREALDRFPETLPVFARHGLDLCCGGVHPIAMAAQAKGVELAGLLRDLEAVVVAVRPSR